MHVVTDAAHAQHGDAWLNYTNGFQSHKEGAAGQHPNGTNTQLSYTVAARRNDGTWPGDNAADSAPDHNPLDGTARGPNSNDGHTGNTKYGNTARRNKATCDTDGETP